MWKTTIREIRGSLGRYLAIFAIIALGVGFFSGLKVTKQAMVDAANRYLKEQNMFDFRLISTIGLTDEDVKAFSEVDGVETARGSYFADAVTTDGDREFVVRYMTTDDMINKPALQAGRLPEKSGEVLVDARHYSSDSIGKTVRIAGNNTEETKQKFTVEEFTIVGLAHSPLYLNYERGTTSVGNGSISSFYYILPEDFAIEAYTDIYLTLKTKEYIYSDEYDSLIESFKPAMEDMLKKRADERLENLIEEGLKSYNIPEAQWETVTKMLKESGQIPDKPTTYVLTRNENIGYSCFENDSQIVDGIAVVFPVFFFLVAALVCITTMSRMIEEQRTQIGVLKALGYGEISIMSKYLIYSGSAAILGCVGGFFLGCYAFPAIIWKVYGLMYGFTDISFVFNTTLFLISLAVSLICSIGTTYISCKTDLYQVSAELIRPKAPKNGKRIFLERVTFIWKRIPFLHKVSLRNVFRYKGRFVMMLLGISGCTGLIITGFGIRDSITEIADAQYTRIMVFDELINFSKPMSEEEMEEFEEKYSDKISAFMPILQTSVDPVDTGSVRSVNLITFGSKRDWQKVIQLHDSDGKQLPFPKVGEVILSQNVAKANYLSVGDKVIFRDSDFHVFLLKVSGICENYFNSYAFINANTYQNAVSTGIYQSTANTDSLNGTVSVEVAQDTLVTADTQGESDTENSENASASDEIFYKSAYVCISEGTDLHEAAAAFSADVDEVSSVSINADTREMFSKMMQTMNYIVIMIIVCAAALAFIVLYNLTNINITERIREIATIKVLGFFANETSSYVFRENMMLTFLGAILGIPVGIWLHDFVMSNIKIDMVSFDVHINFISYIFALLFTFAFAIFVDFVMYFKLAKINMAESLKSIE